MLRFIGLTFSLGRFFVCEFRTSRALWGSWCVHFRVMAAVATEGSGCHWSVITCIFSCCQPIGGQTAA